METKKAKGKGEKATEKGMGKILKVAYVGTAVILLVAPSLAVTAKVDIASVLVGIIAIWWLGLMIGHKLRVNKEEVEKEED